jgi:hypothetical protein
MKFKQAQKFRVIVGGVSVYVTAKQIRWGVGDQIATNAAVYFAFNNLQESAPASTGLCTRVGALDVQIDTL